MDASDPKDMDTSQSQQDLSDHLRQNQATSNRDSPEPSRHEFVHPRTQTPTPFVPDKDIVDNNEPHGLSSPSISALNMSSTVLVRSALNPPVPNLPTLTLSPRDEPNEDEKHGYYYGIPSRPLLVARSNTQPWQSHPFSSSWPSAKTLQAVERSHPIAEAWCSGLFRQIIEVLKNVSFTTIDVVRIGYLQDKELPPVVLWIGVPNNSLSSRVGNEIVDACVSFTLICPTPAPWKLD